MSLLGTRRAAEDLQRAFEGAPAAGLSAPTASLVALGERLRQTGTQLETVARPREDFRASLRTRLVAVATVQPVTAAPAARASSSLLGLGARGQKAAGVAAGALASVVAVSGVAVASSQALPGDPFYGVKRTAEDLQLRLAGDEAARGDRHLQFAQTRLDEVRELTVGRDTDLSDVLSRTPVSASPDADWDRVRETLGDMDAETRLGSSLLEQVWRETGDIGVLTALSDFASEQSAELQALLPLMAPAARGEAEASLGLVAELGQKASALLSGTCTQACGPGASPSQPGPGGECECADDPSSQPSGSASPAPTRSPAAEPSGSAPPSVPAPSVPAPSGAPAPPPTTTPAPGPLPPLPTGPVPTPLLPTELPSELSSGMPTVAPSLPLPPAPPPVPSGDPALDDLAPGGPGPLLPG